MSNCAITYVATVNGRAAGFTAIVPESYNWIQRSANKGAKGSWPRRCGQVAMARRTWCTGTRPGWVGHLASPRAEVGYPEPFLHQPQRRLFREHRTVVLPEFQGMGALIQIDYDSKATRV